MKTAASVFSWIGFCVRLILDFRYFFSSYLFWLLLVLFGIRVFLLIWRESAIKEGKQTVSGILTLVCLLSLIRPTGKIKTDII